MLALSVVQDNLSSIELTEVAEPDGSVRAPTAEDIPSYEELTALLERINATGVFTRIPVNEIDQAITDGRLPREMICDLPFSQSQVDAYIENLTGESLSEDEDDDLDQEHEDDGPSAPNEEDEEED